MDQAVVLSDLLQSVDISVDQVVHCFNRHKRFEKLALIESHLVVYADIHLTQEVGQPFMLFLCLSAISADHIKLWQVIFEVLLGNGAQTLQKQLVGDVLAYTVRPDTLASLRLFMYQVFCLSDRPVELLAPALHNFACIGCRVEPEVGASFADGRLKVV